MVYWYHKEAIMQKFWLFTFVLAIFGLILTVLRGRK